MPNIGTYLLLSFVGPGIVISACLLLLWPETHSIILEKHTEVFISLVIAIAFLNGHIPFLLERVIFDPLWDFLYPELKLNENSNVMLSMNKILVEAEHCGVRHSQFDQVFGEFIFYYNTSFWLFIISGVRLLVLPCGAMLLLATVIIFVSSIISLAWTSALYKKQVYYVLNCMKKIEAPIQNTSKLCKHNNIETDKED